MFVGTAVLDKLQSQPSSSMQLLDSFEALLGLCKVAAPGVADAIEGEMRSELEAVRAKASSSGRGGSDTPANVLTSGEAGAASLAGEPATMAPIGLAQKLVTGPRWENWVSAGDLQHRLGERSGYAWTDLCATALGAWFRHVCLGRAVWVCLNRAVCNSTGSMVSLCMPWEVMPEQPAFCPRVTALHILCLHRCLGAQNVFPYYSCMPFHVSFPFFSIITPSTMPTRK